jgi:isoleucyl-tRNA synthetase
MLSAFSHPGMAQDYKNTLNLPKTGFPMRANLVQREPERVARWLSDGVYQAAQDQNRNGPVFVLHDGPPFTNGDVHIGTALNKVLKDITVRYKTARGFRAPYVPGWDCHGLPIEHKVTKELREKGGDLGTTDLRAACDAFAESWIARQRGQFQRLGVLADWQGEYKTKDPAYEAEILRTFAAFIEQGLVYRSKKPIYWSIPCETALAEAEIEYKDHVSPSIWVKFPFPAAKNFGIEAPASVVIWTTTPWTIPANLAIAVHPNLEYAWVQSGAEVYLVAAALVEKFAADCELESYQTLGSVQGAALERLEARHPFIDRASPITLADYVTTETGTGAVHTAPGHGLEDYHTGLKYGLEIYCPLDDQGRYVDDGQIPAALVGATVLETEGRSPANQKVLELLKHAGALLQLKRFSHSYPHCWRSKTPLVFRAMDQWFVSLDRAGMRQKALEAIGQVQWIPAWGENRIRSAVENRPDWCISRQRSWGVPIPAFFDEDGAAYLDGSVVRAVADKIATRGTNWWFSSDAEEILEGIELPPEWRGRRLKAGRDTLDVWIDSGSSHLAVLKAREQQGLSWPADLYLEGSDQHRGWFQSSLWTGVIAAGAAPYKAVLTHGFIVDQDGRKISKSGAYKKPQTADIYVGQYGADVVRLWISSQDFRNDIPVSEEILSHIGETYRLIRNTLRYQISNLYDFDPARHAVPDVELDLLDRWALSRAAELARQIEAAYENYEFHRVYQLVNQFCSVTLSSVYHDVLKDRLYTLAANHPQRRSSQTAIHRIFTLLSKLLGPILPFTTDEAWAHLKSGTDFCSEPSLLQPWPDVSGWTDEQAAADVDQLLAMRAMVNERIEAARQAGEIGKSLEAKVHISGPTDDGRMQLLQRREAALPELFIVSQVKLEAHSRGDLTIATSKADGGRCPRCWRWLEELSGGPDNTEPCPRCQEALAAISS